MNCACPHYDAYDCPEMRYKRPLEGHEEPCNCACHERDEETWEPEPPEAGEYRIASPAERQP